MPRSVVRRTFSDGIRLPTDAEDAKVAAAVVGRNAERGVTWIHSYVVEDRGTTFCIYDGPDPQAVRDVAGANGLPCDAVTAVSVPREGSGARRAPLFFSRSGIRGARFAIDRARTPK